MRRPDGTVAERGVFSNGVLHIGQVLSPDGSVQAEVNRPREAQLAIEAKEQAEAERKRQIEQERAQKLQERLLEEQRTIAEAQAAEAKFRQDLETLNVGQLFALADELTVAGNAQKARSVRRALISRFPDHPLAAQAVQQLSVPVTLAPLPPAISGDRTASPAPLTPPTAQNQPPVHGESRLSTHSFSGKSVCNVKMLEIAGKTLEFANEPRLGKLNPGKLLADPSLSRTVSQILATDYAAVDKLMELGRQRADNSLKSALAVSADPDKMRLIFASGRLSNLITLADIQGVQENRHLSHTGGAFVAHMADLFIYNMGVALQNCRDGSTVQSYVWPTGAVLN